MSETENQENNKRSNVEVDTIQLSSKKRTLRFYVQLALKLLKKDGSVNLSGLGSAIGTAVNVTEILRDGGFVKVEKIHTSTVTMSKGKSKTKIFVSLSTTDDFDKKFQKWSEEEEKHKEERKKRREENESKGDIVELLVG